jgi:hypothetical protein
MKRIVLITGAILISCLFVSVYATPSAVAQTSQTVDEYDAVNQAEQDVVYILKAESGKLVVYVKGESSPCLETNTYVSNLPKSDILRLEKGIEISGKENLRKSLEDYCS